MTLIALLRDALARVVAVRESLEFGDTPEAATFLYELEIDLAGALSEYEEAAA